MLYYTKLALFVISVQISVPPSPLAPTLSQALVSPTVRTSGRIRNRRSSGPHVGKESRVLPPPAADFGRDYSGRKSDERWVGSVVSTFKETSGKNWQLFRGYSGR